VRIPFKVSSSTVDVVTVYAVVIITKCPVIVLVCVLSINPCCSCAAGFPNYAMFSRSPDYFNITETV